MEIKSTLVWPNVKDGGPCLGWADSCENKSEDTHRSESAAEAICETLFFQGFGCEGRIFPLEARVDVSIEEETKTVYRIFREEGRVKVERNN